MQAYGLIIALFVNIFSKETNRQLKQGPMPGGRLVGWLVGGGGGGDGEKRV